MRLATFAAAVLMLAVGAGADKPKEKPKPVTRVVYLIDGGRSMEGKDGDLWQALVGEVAKSFDRLTNDQVFAVFLMTQDGTTQIGGVGMQKPGDEQKKAAWEAMAAHEPRGVGNERTAIEACAKFTPDLVWYVSDGYVPDTAATLRTFEKVAANRFPVNTIATLLQPDAEAWQFDLLKRIADKTGGKCVGTPPPEEKKKPIPKPPVRPKGPSIFDE